MRKATTRMAEDLKTGLRMKLTFCCGLDVLDTVSCDLRMQLLFLAAAVPWLIGDLLLPSPTDGHLHHMSLLLP